MIIEFDSKEYIEQIQIAEQLNLLQEKTQTINKQINYDESVLSNRKEDLKQYSIFSRFNKKNRQRMSFIKNEIKEIENRLMAERKEYNELNKQIDEINNQITNLEKARNKDYTSSVLKTDGTTITITDDGIVPEKKDASDETVMVHCTDFFPRDRRILCDYDGRKTGELEITYKGVTKKCQSLFHRHSCHFTLNSVVRSTVDGAGTWNQPKFVVIDPLENNKKNFVSLDPSDSWTYGSVILSERPILLVREDVFNEIPKNELSNYNIIKYSGNYDTCVENAITLFGYKIKRTDKNYAGHQHSEEFSTEYNLNHRNLCLNYIFDNSYNGIDNIFLNDEQMAYFYGVLKTLIPINLVYHPFYHTIAELSGVPLEFVEFIIDSGIQKKKDRYTFKTDDELYFETKKINKCLANKKRSEDISSFISENIDIKNIQEIYRAYINNAKDEVTEKQKILFEYGQEFGDFKRASTGNILNKEQNDLFEEYQHLIEKDIKSLSEEELKTVIEVQNIKLSLLSKEAKEKEHKYLFKTKEIVTAETSENLKKVGAYLPPDDRQLVLTFRAPDIKDTIATLSGINFDEIYEKINNLNYEDESELYNFSKQVSDFPDLHTRLEGEDAETDFNFSDCKTVGELSDRVIACAKLYERLYDGEKIKFDKQGNLTGEIELEEIQNDQNEQSFEQAQKEFEKSTQQQERKEILQALSEEELKKQTQNTSIRTM